MDQPEQDIGPAGAEGQHAQQECQEQECGVRRVQAQNQRLVERVGGEPDRRNGQADGRERGPERQG